VPAPGAFLALLGSLLAVNLSKTHQFFGIQGLEHAFHSSERDFSIVAYGRGPVTQQGAARAVR
jgi:hypothetical protein